MKIIYRKGDLLESGIHVIAHGCNNRGVMGSGIAKAIRSKYPQAYEDYHFAYVVNGNFLMLGRIVWVDTVDRLIANCITQDGYGRDGKQYVSYDAIRSCINGINTEAKNRQRAHMKPYDQEPYYEFGLPKIGAGLGGGDWEIISSIIEEECVDVQPIVYEL